MIGHYDHHDNTVDAREVGDRFSTETSGVAPAAIPETADLRDGDAYDLRIHLVRKPIGDAEVRMFGYNNSIPGPTLRVRQGSEITVNATNDGDVETAPCTDAA